ncbi:AAA family ATPase [Nonomuraea sp. NPDC049607]|uniref:ATP-binding protein n=1 Tax=Nonomuraea sp. NPDC049607 TaxID=3154732 RepID=UPI003416B7BA
MLDLLVVVVRGGGHMSRLARPGRRQTPIPDPGSVLGRFAQSLRELRDQAGDPSYRLLARETARSGSPYSETSLRNAASGRFRPSWEVVEMFIRACVAFASEHPHRADAAARGWDVQVLLDEWTTCWREMSISDDVPAGGHVRPEPGAEGFSDVPGNLPVALMSFMGRRHELAEGRRLMRQVRLVTLTGVGGVGKTRLALRLAEQVADRFPGGVWLTELAAVTDRAMVDHAVAAVMGVPLRADEQPRAGIARALSGQQVLLVLDNCEHLLGEAADLARSLLQAVPGLSVLATSRQTLGVVGEHVLEVSPLPLPAEGGTDSVAVELFCERARAVAPEFRLTAENRAAVARVCRLLDGLPLALELAARRLRTLSVGDLLKRLDQRFLLLGTAGADRTAHPRHRTLRAVFDWSYELCTPDERRVWERLSVSAGSVSLGDAEVICGDGTPRSYAVFEAITALVDKSLLGRMETGGRTRLHMLETVRLYGRERLASSGGEGLARRRHHDRYLWLACQAEELYATPQQGLWLVRLGEEHGNLRQLFAAAPGADVESDLFFAGAYALWLYWVASGNVGEGALWMRRIAERHPEPPGPELSQVWCRAHWCAAIVLMLHGDRAGAERSLSLIEARLEGTGDGWTAIRAGVHQLRGLLALFVGDVEGVEEHSRAALLAGTCRAGMLTRQQALAQLGLAASMNGDRQAARDFFREGLDLSESCGEIWHRSYLLWTLAIECVETGETGEAMALLWQSLDLKRRLGDKLGAATVSEALAWALAQSGQPYLGALLLGAAHIAWKPAGAPQLWGFAHLVDGRDRSVTEIRRRLGDGRFDEAYRLGESLGLARALEKAARL